MLVVTGRTMTCGLPRTGFCSGGIPTLRSSPMDFMTVVQIAMSIRQFRGSKAAAYRMAWELRLHSADGQPRHKHFHLPHGLPLRRRACRRIRLPSLSDWRLEPSVTRPKKKEGSKRKSFDHGLPIRRGPGCLWAKAGCRRCSPDSIKFKVATRRIEGLGTHLRRSFAGPHLLLVRIVQRLQRAHSIVRLFAPKGAC